MGKSIFLSFRHLTVKKTASCFEHYFSLYLIHIFMCAFFIVFNIDFVYLTMLERGKRVHSKDRERIWETKRAKKNTKRKWVKFYFSLQSK